MQQVLKQGYLSLALDLHFPKYTKSKRVAFKPKPTYIRQMHEKVNI